jgi:hypothetical protein
LNKDNLYRIAWSYLRLKGLAKTHVGYYKLQFYRYYFNSKKYANLPVSSALSNVPEVYFDFLWPEKSQYSSFLSLNLSAGVIPKIQTVEKDPIDVFEVEEIDEKLKT